MLQHNGPNLYICGMRVKIQLKKLQSFPISIFAVSNQIDSLLLFTIVLSHSLFWLEKYGSIKYTSIVYMYTTLGTG